METSFAMSSDSNPSLLQIKKVNVVCRLNQARSIFSELWLRLMYPGLEISSYGMEADSRIPIPKNVREIASNWGHDLTGIVSKHIDLLPKDEALDTMYIFSENEYLQRFNSKNWNCRKNYSFQSLSLDQDLVPIDPVALKKSDEISLEVEIAKAMLCTSIAFHLATEKDNPVSKIFYPYDASAVLRTLNLALEHRTKNAVLLNLDFHYNGYRIFEDSSSIIEWDGTLNNMIDCVIPSLRNPAIPKYYVRPNKEHFNSARLILSVDFLNSIWALSEQFQVIAICGPFKVNEKQQVATILSMALAAKLQRVY